MLGVLDWRYCVAVTNENAVCGVVLLSFRLFGIF